MDSNLCAEDAVVTAVVDELAPTIISNLADIVVAINSTVNTTLSILPPTIDTVAALAIEEAESLISVLSEIQTIVDDIEAVIVPLLAEVAAGKFPSFYSKTNLTNF